MEGAEAENSIIFLLQIKKYDSETLIFQIFMFILLLNFWSKILSNFPT